MKSKAQINLRKYTIFVIHATMQHTGTYSEYNDAEIVNEIIGTINKYKIVKGGL